MTIYNMELPTTPASPMALESNEAKKVFPCTLCEKKFSYKNGLHRHVRLTHAKEKPYECDICHKKFGYKHILQEHQNLHYGNKPYACQFCDKKFAARSNLVQHRMVHKRLFHCPLCKKRFQDEDRLRNHIATHPHSVPVCTICQFEAANHMELVKHLVAVHAPSLPPLDQKPDRTKAPSRPNSNSSHSNGVVQTADPCSSTVSPIERQPVTTSTSVSTPQEYTFIKREEDQEHVVGQTYMAAPVSLPTIDAIFPQRGFIRPMVPINLLGHQHMFPASCAPEMRPSPISPPISRYNDTSPTSSQVSYPSPRSSGTSMLSPDQQPYITPVSSTHATRDTGTQHSAEMAGYPDLDQVISYYISLGRLFKCAHCEILFYERGMYFLHASLHGNSSPWECSICHKICADKNEFTLHFVNQQHS